MSDFFEFYCKNNKPVTLETQEEDGLFEIEDKPSTDPEPNSVQDNQNTTSDLENKVAKLEKLIKELTGKSTTPDKGGDE